MPDGIGVSLVNGTDQGLNAAFDCGGLFDQQQEPLAWLPC